MICQSTEMKALPRSLRTSRLPPSNSRRRGPRRSTRTPTSGELAPATSWETEYATEVLARLQRNSSRNATRNAVYEHQPGANGERRKGAAEHQPSTERTGAPPAGHEAERAEDLGPSRSVHQATIPLAKASVDRHASKELTEQPHATIAIPSLYDRCARVGCGRAGGS